MGSERIRRHSNEHKVEHTFSGKYHYFKITSTNGPTYNVAIQALCDCEFMGKEGVATGKFCSHIIAVMKKIGLDNKVEKRGTTWVMKAD